MDNVELINKTPYPQRIFSPSTGLKFNVVEVGGVVLVPAELVDDLVGVGFEVAKKTKTEKEVTKNA